MLLLKFSSSTIFHRKLDPFCLVSYYIKWVKTSWTRQYEVPVLRDAVCSGDKVSVVDEGAPAHVHIVVLLLLQERRLPQVLP
mgnify:CR=1 FL=1